MQAQVDEIADRVYRISTVIPEVAPGGFSFNQFLVDGDEPILFHLGMRQLFPLVSAAVEQVMPLDRLRWLTFAHVEADESGAVNQFLEAAPNAQVAHGALGCMVSVNDLCDRPPRMLGEGEFIEVGGPGEPTRRLMEIATPHVPHNWESHLLFEEQTRTLFCGDLGTQIGETPAITDQDLLEAAMVAEDMFRSTSLGPAVPETLRRLADLEPKTLAIMHGASYNGDCPKLLRTLADVYEQRYGCGPVVVPAQPMGG